MAHFQLDTQGLLCPMPVIKTQNKIKELSIGDTLEVLANDPGVMHDIPAWCRVHGHELLRVEEYEETGEDAWGRQIIRITIRVCR